MPLTELEMTDEIIEIADEICSEWECEFLESIREQLVNGRELSPKQKDILERLYEKACSSDH